MIEPFSFVTQIFTIKALQKFHHFIPLFLTLGRGLICTNTNKILPFDLALHFWFNREEAPRQTKLDKLKVDLEKANEGADVQPMSLNLQP